MNDVTLQMNDNTTGSFIIQQDNKEIGEMAFTLTDGEISVDHTEVEPEFEGKGMANQMFLKMIDYARENKLKVIANCAYVQKQIEKNKDEYADVT